MALCSCADPNLQIRERIDNPTAQFAIEGLFIGLLAFPDPALQNKVKVGVLVGSLISALCGAALLRVAKREPSKFGASSEAA